MGINGGNHTEYYFEAYMRFNAFDICSAPDGTHQFKIVRLYSSGSQSLNLYPGVHCDAGWHHAADYHRPEVLLWDSLINAVPKSPSGWNHLAVYYKKSSAPGANDGKAQVFWNHRLVWDWASNYAKPENNPNGLFHGDFDSNGADLASDWAVGDYFSSASPDTSVDFDDVVLDHTQARVLLCNASTYAAATVCETQEPRTWTDSRIEVRENLGALARNATLYAYVVDRNGSVSPGLAVPPAGCYPSADQAALYEHTNYQGSCVVKGIGTYGDAAAMAPLQDNTASSVRVGADVEVEPCQGAGLTGTCQTFQGDVADLTGSPLGNDTASSLQVAARAAATAAGRYTPLTPARILDTRDGTGGISTPVGPGASVDVQVAGRGGVPAAGVSAVAMNVTVTQPSAAGWLTLSPAGSPRPLAANLNFTPGETVPNLVVAKLGAGGKAALFNSAGNSHVIFDVAGWYSDGGAAGNDGRYTALTPARILDTRDGTGAAAVRLGPGASLDLQVAGRGGVPASGAEAAVLNVAATNTTDASYLTVLPAGATRPLASNLNFNGGDTVSNRLMASLGTGGKVTIYNNAGSADVVVDVGGWYSGPSLAGASGAYTPLVPARILDTRDATGGITGPVAGGTSVDVQVTGRGGVPASGVSAVILNATVTQPAGPGWLTISPTGAARPLASDLNFAAGETRPNLVVARVGDGGRVNVFTPTGAHVVFDVAGWFS